ncbi:conserved hypothetical protein [Theileria equi strain WA]|uniref:Uncharacterized protein n=1 Tax=Theileria equi strain WA TaxID=1537102 RepID=L1LBH8_THEEQ|nr:conserved hypothetical protein [Theileria equi strain WA]EKX72691.1 conserved hypothetical protein [Theileria equi strain WA]|eukprot:XP_004832143.1 conserved hypothetical protein [Theileria equi strain WA]
MDWNIINKKLKLLGYDFPNSCLESFKTIVLKLEEEQIRLYEIPQRGKLKASDQTTWMKGFLNYCRDLGVVVEKEMLSGKDLSPQAKMHLLNKLLNIAIKEKYQDASEEGHIHEFSLPVEQETKSETIASAVAQINEILAKLQVPPLEEDAGESEAKPQTTSEDDNESIYSLCQIDGSAHDANVDRTTLLLRSLYTHDLRKLQSDIIWLTRRYGKIVGAQGALLETKS